MNESRRVLVGLGAGLVLGLAIAASHNSTLVRVVDAVAPAGTLWVNAIRMTIIPLVVSLVITGVASTSNVGAISRIGGRTLLVFLAMLVGATILAIPLGIAVFSWLSHLVPVRPGLPPGAAEAAASLSAGPNPVGFWNWVQSLIPTNPIVVSDLDRARPIWFGGQGRREEDFDQFFAALGARKTGRLQLAVMDMWRPFRNSLERNAPQARIVFDKFHVLRHLSDALDEVRRSEYRRLAGQDRTFIKGQR
jgi:hypothetical protein